MASTTAETMVTRLKKRRNLETAMNTIKNLLKPAVTNKRGSRKKNKPRNIAKKVVTPKIQRYCPTVADDAEYFPNKLKRNVETKKVFLKPKHKLKVVIATNKRKRRTPCKGLDPTDLDTCVLNNPLFTVAPIKPVTIISYKRNCLSMEDIVRMDEDSLNDEDLMEILTCPSPVWWEEPPEEREFSSPFLNEELVDAQNENFTTKMKENQEIEDLVKLNVKKKKGTFDVKKMAKLENILVNIRSRVTNKSTDVEHVNMNLDTEMRETDNINEDSNYIKNNDSNSNDMDSNVEHQCDDDDSKPRTISSSGSEISLNEDDLLRSLQSIDIPIQKREQNVNRVEEMNVEVVLGNDDDDVKAVDSVAKISTSIKTTDLKKAAELKNKEIMKRLQPESNDILDVKIIKTSTNATSEITIWSSLSDFKRQNLNMDTTDEVIDIEDELEFTLIRSPSKNTLKQKADETILIDDDSNDAQEKKGDVIHLGDGDIEKCKEFVTDVPKSQDSFMKITKVEMVAENIVNKKVTEKIVIEKVKETVTEIDNEKLNKAVSKMENKKVNEIANENNIIKEDIRICDLAVRIIEKESDYVRNSEESNEIMESTKEVIQSENTDTDKPTETETETSSNSESYCGGIEIKKVDTPVQHEKESLATLKETELYQSSDDIEMHKADISMIEAMETNNENKKATKHQESNRFIKNNFLKYIEQRNDNIKSYNNGVLRIIKKIPDLHLNETSNLETKIINIIHTNDDNLPDSKSNMKNIGVQLPLILPTLTKNLTRELVDSPKSMNSLNTDFNEYSEGTISDSNVEFIDEFDTKSDNTSIMDEEYLEEEGIEKESDEGSNKNMQEEYLDDESEREELLEYETDKIVEETDKTQTEELVTIYKIVDSDPKSDESDKGIDNIEIINAINDKKDTIEKINSANTKNEEMSSVKANNDEICDKYNDVETNDVIANDDQEASFAGFPQSVIVDKT